MSGLFPLVLAFVAGLAIGAVYFAGLWWNVKRIAGTAPSATRVAGNLLIRLAMAAAVFYAILVFGHWPHLLAALAGFAATRTLALRHVSKDPTNSGNEERAL